MSLSAAACLVGGHSQADSLSGALGLVCVGGTFESAMFYSGTFAVADVS